MSITAGICVAIEGYKMVIGIDK